MNVHSVSAELATVARKTRGTVPPKLVGASTTVVGSKMYLFGGRLVVERRMLSDLYVFDLETVTWAKIDYPSESVVPGPRYFHSADTWNNHLVIFGGMGYKTADQAQENLCVLNDVCFYSLAESRWLSTDETPPSPLPTDSLIPRARYAHLSSVSSDMLFIIGGQDIANGWLDDIHVYDLRSRSWVHRSDYPRHCGTYRSVALSSSLCVRSPDSEPTPPPAPRFRSDAAPSVLPVTSPDTFVHLPYSVPPSSAVPSEIFLYSNYNFTDVKRELEVFTPQPPSSFTITDRSTSMTGISLPPGLRFPTGAILGTSLIIAGTYLAHSYQAFSIWSLDLTTMSWSRIEPGTALATGSWCRAVLWREANKLLVFGNREGNLVEDYNHRLLSWDHIAYIDLEAFAIYQPPSPGLGFGREAQAMGLSALEDGAFADFEIVCDDGRRIACSRKMLEERWPWFHNQRQLYLAAAATATESAGTSPVPPLPAPPGSVDGTLLRPDPRLTPRALHLAEPYPITVAFLQYLYAQALLTPLQHAPAVLSALLLLSSTYELKHLKELVKHAMHTALSASGQGVSGVYDVATLCDCQSLRLRAMRMFKNTKRPPRVRTGHERHGGSGSSHGRGGSGHHHHHARPRGLSDANQGQQGPPGSGSADQSQSFGAGQTNGLTSHALVKDGSSPQDNATKAPSLTRRPSRKSSLGRLLELEPVSEVPSPSDDSFGTRLSSPTESNSDRGLPDVSENLASEDEDEFDPELLGLDSAFASAELAWSSTGLTRASYNACPSSSQFGPNLPEADDYFFGTQPDHSPLMSSFSPPERPTAFHLPYPTAYRPSRSASVSDTPSLLDALSTTHSSEESHSSSGTLSTSSPNSSVPVTPLSPALAEIVDAVAKVAVAAPSPDRRLPRQTSLQSIDEHAGLDDQRQSVGSEYDKRQSLSNFPLPPQSTALAPPHQLPRLKTSLGNISEAENNRSQDWLRIDTTLTIPSRSPGESFSSLDLTASSPRSLSRKSSFDRLTSDRRSSLTPASPGGLVRLLSPKRSSSRLEKEVAKARSKAEKLEQKLREQEQRMRDQSDKEASQTNILSGLWSPKSPRFSRSDEKKRKKELEKQKLKGIAEEARLRADSHGFENKVGKSGEKWAVSGIGGL